MIYINPNLQKYTTFTEDDLSPAQKEYIDELGEQFMVGDFDDKGAIAIAARDNNDPSTPIIRPVWVNQDGLVVEK